MKLEEYRNLFKNDSKPRKSKLKNEPTTYNGRLYASRKEAKKAIDLDWQLKQGEIQGWEAQVNYNLEIDGQHITTYRLDFRVLQNDGTYLYIDVKGRKAGLPYEHFKIKQRLMKILLGIDVVEC